MFISVLLLGDENEKSLILGFMSFIIYCMRAIIICYLDIFEYHLFVFKEVFSENSGLVNG